MRLNDYLGIQMAERAGKPRQRGLTMVNDMGWPAPFVENAFVAFGQFVDILKFPPRLLNWDVAEIRRKIEVCKRHNVVAQPGGVVLEIARAQGKLDEVLTKLSELGFDSVEASNSERADRDMRAEREFVRRCERYGFRIVGEVGKKFPTGDVTRYSDRELNVDETIEQFQSLLETGAKYIYWEGHVLRRVVGDTGDEILARWPRVGPQIEKVVEKIGLDKIIFEVSTHCPYTHRRQQQFWWVRTFGPDVNIGNVRLEEVPLLEDIRRGMMPIFGFGEMGDHPWLQSVDRGHGKAGSTWWKEKTRAEQVEEKA